MMLRDLVNVAPVLILGFAEQPSTSLSMGGLDGRVTSIDLIKPQGIQEASSFIDIED